MANKKNKRKANYNRARQGQINPRAIDLTDEQKAVLQSFGRVIGNALKQAAKAAGETDDDEYLEGDGDDEIRNGVYKELVQKPTVFEGSFARPDETRVIDNAEGSPDKDMFGKGILWTWRNKYETLSVTAFFDTRINQYSIRAHGFAHGRMTLIEARWLAEALLSAVWWERGRPPMESVQESYPIDVDSNRHRCCEHCDLSLDLHAPHTLGCPKEQAETGLDLLSDDELTALTDDLEEKHPDLTVDIDDDPDDTEDYLRGMR